MSNLSAEWQAMAKLVSQFYAKADAGEFFFVSCFIAICAVTWNCCMVVGIWCWYDIGCCAVYLYIPVAAGLI